MDDLEKRLTDLEVKFSYQDQLINELNMIVAEQGMEIDKLKKLTKSLNEQLTKGGDHNTSLENDRPPHY